MCKCYKFKDIDHPDNDTKCNRNCIKIKQWNEDIFDIEIYKCDHSCETIFCYLDSKKLLERIRNYFKPNESIGPDGPDELDVSDVPYVSDRYVRPNGHIELIEVISYHPSQHTNIELPYIMINIVNNEPDNLYENSQPPSYSVYLRPPSYNDYLKREVNA